MILTSEAIKENIKRKNIIIDPYNEENLNPNSYDVRLDKTLQVYEMIVQNLYGEKIMNSVEICFDKGFMGNCWCHFIDAKKENPTAIITIPEDGYVLVPGVLYLGSTVEYTETHGLVPTIEGKSSIGRLGVDVHKTAGFGDLSFCGQWTLEITVVQPVKIYPYMKIAQLIYSEVSGNITKLYNGKYQMQKGVVASKAYQDFYPKINNI